MRCVYYYFMKCSEFSLKYGVVVVEFSRPLEGPDVIGQDAEGNTRNTNEKTDRQSSTFDVFGRRMDNGNGMDIMDNGMDKENLPKIDSTMRQCISKKTQIFEMASFEYIQ
ncbi:hypothetical protein AVEN_15633-1 [Araneus ventricosus]|uniref:Uncharacterized protein n=1 Tax=Araneus ventricosus TaxID=182803 RepID=A0A4Y2LKF4_ARAVE|nr:hypothetical protein AVEN_15633-1 [Araneus ventricosus]